VVVVEGWEVNEQEDEILSVGDRRGTGARQSGWCVKVCARWCKVVLDVSFVRGYAIRTCPSLANKHRTPPPSSRL
jgi:hypothetical protein